MAMAQNGKPELTEFKAFVLLQSNTAWCLRFPEGVPTSHTLQSLPLASFDQTDRIRWEGTYRTDAVQAVKILWIGL